MRDASLFRERFKRWKNGEQVYENGRPIKDYNTWKRLIRQYKGLDIDNDITYDYQSFYYQNPEEAWDILRGAPDAHFSDRYKTVYHPTFSDESIYSDKIDFRYNPRGIVGGHWEENPDVFIPSPSKRDMDSLRETADYISVAEPNGLQIRDEYGRYPRIDGTLFGGVLPTVSNSYPFPKYAKGKDDGRSTSVSFAEGGFMGPGDFDTNEDPPRKNQKYNVDSTIGTWTSELIYPRIPYSGSAIDRKSSERDIAKKRQDWRTEQNKKKHAANINLAWRSMSFIPTPAAQIVTNAADFLGVSPKGQNFEDTDFTDLYGLLTPLHNMYDEKPTKSRRRRNLNKNMNYVGKGFSYFPNIVNVGGDFIELKNALTNWWDVYNEPVPKYASGKDSIHINPPKAWNIY